MGLHLSCAHTLFCWKTCRLFQPPLPHPPCRTAAVFRAELGEHVSSAPGKEDRASAGRPPGPGRENPALALRRAAECGAYARPASRGLVSICPFCLRVKLAGENPVIRAQPLGEHRLPAPPPPPTPAPSPILTDGKNDSIGRSRLPASINAAASVPGAWGGWAPSQETAEGGARRAACPFPG